MWTFLNAGEALSKPCARALLLWAVTGRDRDRTSPAVGSAGTSQQQTELESGNNHVQSSIKVNAHLFERKGAVSRKTVLKIHHLYFVSRLMFGKYHKSPAARVLLHHCAPKAAGGFGAGELREPISSPKLFPPAAADKASLFSLPLPLCLLWLLALITLCFYKFHMLLPFILSSLTGMTLREWSLFSDSLEKEFLSWRWRLWGQWNIFARKMCLVPLCP